MMRFGFSAFLKLLCLNERPRRSLLKSRLLTSGGRDYHRSFRLRARRHLVDGVPIDEVLASIGKIKKASERVSAQLGLKKLLAWRAEHLGGICDYPAVTFKSPTKAFNVTFTPDFGIEIDGIGVAVHIWNTRTPALAPGLVYAALSLFRAIYTAIEHPPDDLAVLDLSGRRPRFFRLSERRGHYPLGFGLAARTDQIIGELNAELRLPPNDNKRDRGLPPP